MSGLMLWITLTQVLTTGFRVFTVALAQPAPKIKGALRPNLQLSCSLWTLIPTHQAFLDLDLMWAHHRRRWGINDLTEITVCVCLGIHLMVCLTGLSLGKLDFIFGSWRCFISHPRGFVSSKMLNFLLIMQSWDNFTGVFSWGYYS